MILVFLNNKLITLDTVLPILNDLRNRQPSLRFKFLCFDPATEAAIKENVVLYDLLRTMGPLKMVGRRRSGWFHFLAHRLVSLGHLGSLFVSALLPRTRFVHFKALNEMPFRLLYRIAPDKTLYVQSTPINLSELEKRADNVNFPRKKPAVIPAAGRLLGFSDGWEVLHQPALALRPRYVVPPGHRLQSWHRYLAGVTDRYLGGILPGDRPADRFGVMVLSSLDKAKILNPPDGFPDLAEETLEAIFECNPELPVLVKPHPATAPRYRRIVREIIARRLAAGQTVVECHLHPLLLAQKAVFFVGNMFSTTFANAKAANVPTIEFTRYAPDALDVTNGGSMRPDLTDHFISGDVAALKRVITDLSGRQPRSPEGLSSVEASNLGPLFDYLAAAPGAGEQGQAVQIDRDADPAIGRRQVL